MNMNEVECNQDTFMRLPHYSHHKPTDYTIIGIPFDTSATFRVGARMAPSKIRRASKNLSNYSVDNDVDIRRDIKGSDYGDIKVLPGYILKTYERIESEFKDIVKTGTVPITIGGDHSITLPQLRVLADHYGPLSLIQFDAHTDTVNGYLGEKYNHATTFRRACEEGLIDPKRSIQIGIRSQIKTISELGFVTISMNKLRVMGIDKVIQQIKSTVGSEKSFLTFDIDIMDPAYAPGTGTMEVGGITSAEAIKMVQSLSELSVIGYDLVEVLPAFDEADITSSLSVSIIKEFICHLAQSRKDEGK